MNQTLNIIPTGSRPWSQSRSPRGIAVSSYPYQEFDIGGETGDGLEAIDAVKKLHPDLAIS